MFLRTCLWHRFLYFQFGSEVKMKKGTFFTTKQQPGYVRIMESDKNVLKLIVLLVTNNEMTSYMNWCFYCCHNAIVNEEESK